MAKATALTPEAYAELTARLVPRLANIVRDNPGALNALNLLRSTIPGLSRAQAGKLVALGNQIRKAIANIPDSNRDKQQPIKDIPVVRPLKDPKLKVRRFIYDITIIYRDPKTGKTQTRRDRYKYTVPVNYKILHDDVSRNLKLPDLSGRLADFLRSLRGKPLIDIEVTGVYRDQV